MENQFKNKPISVNQKKFEPIIFLLIFVLQCLKLQLYHSCYLVVVPFIPSFKLSAIARQSCNSSFCFRIRCILYLLVHVSYLNSAHRHDHSARALSRPSCEIVLRCLLESFFSVKKYMSMNFLEYFNRKTCSHHSALCALYLRYFKR